MYMDVRRSASGSTAEDLFIELFSGVFGAEKAGYLYFQYHFHDICQSSMISWAGMPMSLHRWFRLRKYRAGELVLSPRDKRAAGAELYDRREKPAALPDWQVDEAVWKQPGAEKKAEDEVSARIPGLPGRKQLSLRYVHNRSAPPGTRTAESQ